MVRTVRRTAPAIHLLDANPARWARRNAVPYRTARLFAGDFEKGRRPQLETLRRAVVALGLVPGTADLLARHFPEAIAPERTVS